MQKAYAEGLRAVYLYTAAHQNADVAELVSGADAELAARVNDLLLPIVKGVGSEKAYELLTESLQTLGGSGYLQDYPIEQYIRDAKIDTLYEGTTAIQAQDFFFRKIARDRGVALAHVAGRIREFIDSEAGNGRLKAERVLLETALTDVQEMAGDAHRVSDGFSGPTLRVVQDRPRLGALSVRGRRPAHRMAPVGASGSRVGSLGP